MRTPMAADRRQELRPILRDEPARGDGIIGLIEDYQALVRRPITPA